MAYQSLYRRYRSQRFDEVLGQDHVTLALRNAVRDGRVAQGYLFSGPRGTGKTSTARILAKVLNCEHPVDGEPDTTCANCVAVQEGRHVDWLHELDAASNNGVDAMRDLLGRVSMGTSGNRKVYVLDEVHMLSTAASNALLKTLEEPPDHVVFVLATTEPEKVLPTIRSRTQHYEFNLLPAEVLAAHVRHVIADAGIDLPADALDAAVDHVVAAGRGSARDTLSALDQVAAAGGVSAATVPVDDVIDALGRSDAGAALVAVDAAVRRGRDPRVLAEALIDALRHAFLHAMGAPSGGLTDRATARAEEISSQLGPASLTRALEAIGASIVEMRHAPDPRIPLEVALVQLARPEAAGDLASLVQRVERLERAVAGGTAPVASDAATTAPPEAVTPSHDSIAAGPAAQDAPGPKPSSPEAEQPAARPEMTPDTGPAGNRPPAATTAPAPVPARGAQAARAKLAQHEATTKEPPAPAADRGPDAASTGRPTLGAVRQARATAAGGDGSGPASSTPPDGSTPATASVPASTDPNQPDPTQPAPPQLDPAQPAPAQLDPAQLDPAQLDPAQPSPAQLDPAQPASTGGDLPSVDALQEAWDAGVLDSLRGRAKALFRNGRFVPGSSSRVRFAVPNEPTLKNCLDKVDEVQAALGDHFGRPVPIELVLDADASAPATGSGDTSGPGRGSAPAHEPDPADDEIDTVDLDELTDAPDATTGGLAQLQDAFPGAELLEDS